MFNIIGFGLLFVLGKGFAEPPSSYLPPQSRNIPSSSYGAPFGGSQGTGKALSYHSQRSGSRSFSYNALHGDHTTFGSASTGLGHSSGYAGLSQQYGTPVSFANGAAGSFMSGIGSAGSGDFRISQEYGAPSFSVSQNKLGINSRLNNLDGSSHRFGVSQQYGVPNYATDTLSFGSPSLSFGGLGSGIGFGISSLGASHSGEANFGSEFGSTGQGLSQQYGVPKFETFGGSSFGSNIGSSSGVSFNSAGSAQGFGISQQYGAPGFRAGSEFGSSSGVSLNHRRRFGASGAKFVSNVSPVYGPPVSSSGADYSRTPEISEPPNYEYNYEVKAADVSGVQFGHQESRELESARGSYHVLLPDGRTQVVEYEANEQGYQPNIRYEEPTGYAGARGLSGPY